MNFKIFIIITAIILESIFFLFYNLLVSSQITKHFLNLAAIVFYVESGFLVLLVLRLLEKGQKGFLTFIKAFYLGLLIFITPPVLITLLKIFLQSDFVTVYNISGALEWINFLVPFVLISFLLSLRYSGKRLYHH